MEAAHCQSMLAVVLLALVASTTKGQLVSQCVKNGTEVRLQCSMETLEDKQYFTWNIPNDHEDWVEDYDYYSYGGRDITFNATWIGSGYDVHKISCYFNIDGITHYSHAVIILSDDHNPVLPIIPVLQKGSNDSSLSLIWENLTSPFNDDVYFNYTVRVNITRGDQYSLSYDVESHKTPNITLNNLSECQQVDISVSLPGNCEAKNISGLLPIVPKQFQRNVSSEPLFSGNGEGQEVKIRFTPPELCPLQPASYILIFDDGNETWSTEPESISNSSQLVLKSMDLQENTESELKRDRNYIVNVTVITEYANVSSTTYFSTHSLLGVGPINLKLQGYCKGSVQVEWHNPKRIELSFTYIINVTLLNSKNVIKYVEESFRQNEDPSVSIDLSGFECNETQITVAVLGAEHGAQSISAVVPSYSTNFIQDVQVEISFNQDNTIREAEISFQPPHMCEFQSSSYILTVSDDNEIIWSNSRDPVEITDPTQQVTVEIESGLVVNTDYNATVTVFTSYANISSNATFRFQLPPVVALPLDTSSGVSSETVGGTAGGIVLVLVILLCGFGTGVVAVYVLRQRKRIKQKNEEHSVQKCMVINPLYGGSDGLYEEIPGNAATTAKMTTAPSAVSAEPNLPPRKHVEPLDLTKNDKLAGTLSSMNDNHSISSSCRYDETEDCYTVMSPAGTVTMLPRNRHSTASLGGSVSLPMDEAP